MTVVILVRHGNTDYNHQRRYQGRLDILLNAEGEKQAAQAAQLLTTEHLAAIYSSPLQRATRTAEIIANCLSDHLPIESVPELTEIDVGTWSDLTPAEVKARYPDEYAAFEADKNSPRGGGESRQQLQDRLIPPILHIAAAHPTETVLVVTHEAVIKALAGWAAHLPLIFQPNLHGVVNASLTYIEVGAPPQNRTRLAAYNLPPVGVSPLGAEMSET